MNRFSVLPLLSGKAIITGPGAVKEMGDDSSTPWSWVEVFLNTWVMCPEMVTTVSLPCSLLSSDVHGKEALFNDAEAIVADQTLLRFGWESPACLTAHGFLLFSPESLTGSKYHHPVGQSCIDNIFLGGEGLSYEVHFTKSWLLLNIALGKKFQPKIKGKKKNGKV